MQVHPFTHRLQWLLALLLMAFAGSSQAQPITQAFAAHQFRKDSLAMPFRMMAPQGDTAGRQFPLVVFLHGAGERGSDNERQLTHGAALFARPDVRSRFPAYVVFPQCPAGDYWSNVHIVRDSSGRYRQLVFKDETKPTQAMHLLENLIDSLVQVLPVDSSRVYVGGLSMGGMGTFELVGRHPGWFAAAFPICGGADTLSAVRMTLPRWYIFHGLADDVVPAVHSQRMIEALEKVGARLQFRFYPGVGHNSWDKALAEPDLLPWLFSSKKEDLVGPPLFSF